MDFISKFFSKTRLLALVLAAVVLCVPMLAQSNQSVWIAPNHCQVTATTTALTAGPAFVKAAASNLVWSSTTDATGGTLTVTCDLAELATRLGSSARITSVSLFYGVQTTAMTSIAAAAFNTVTYATPGAAAAGTVSAAAGGVLTVTPASLQLTTTTTGQCFNERVSFGTPIQLLDGSAFTMEQVFTKSAAITILQICGIQVNYKWVQ